MVNTQPKPRTIVRIPGIVGGEPVIEGTRIPVRSIVLVHYAYGGVEATQQQYPQLSVADVEAAMQFYREHREEINVYIAENSDDDIPYDQLG